MEKRHFTFRVFIHGPIKIDFPPGKKYFCIFENVVVSPDSLDRVLLTGEKSIFRAELSRNGKYSVVRASQIILN